MALGKASTDDKCHFAIPWARSFNIKLSATFYQNIPNGLRVKFHFFQNLNLGKTSTNPKCHLTISWAIFYLVNTNVYAKFHHNSPLSSRDRAIFILFRIWRSAKPRPIINVSLQFLELDLVNSHVSAKFNQNIPNGLRVKFHCFQNFNLGKTSTNPKCHLTISMATSCQYQFVYKISSQYSSQFKRLGHFHFFFRIWSSAKPRPIKKVSSQSLGLDLVNINVYARVIKIFHSVQEIGPFSLFQNLAPGRASTDDKCHFAIPWARSFQHQIVCHILSCQYQCVCKISS